MPERTIIETNQFMLTDFPALASKDGKLTEAEVGLVSQVLRAIIDKINGLLSFGDGIDSHRAGNFNAQVVRHLTPAAPDTEFIVVHGLGRTPVGYDVFDKDAPAHVYSSSRNSWNDQLLYLKCDGSSVTISLRVY